MAMSILNIFPLNQLKLQINKDNIGRKYIAFPNVNRPRWIIPSDFKLRQSGLSLYVPNSIKGYIYKMLMRFGHIWGEEIYLEETTLDELERNLENILNEENIRLAFYTGTPGAYRKATAQIMNSKGRVLAYCKIASSSFSKEVLNREHKNLLRLESNKNLRNRVPRVVDYINYKDCKLLITTAGPNQKGPMYLSTDIIEFLKDLYSHNIKEYYFYESPMKNKLNEKYFILNNSYKLPIQWVERYRKVVNLLNKYLDSVKIPFSFVHRDLAPWNIRKGPQGLFVFDWESAEDNNIILYDVFHFEAIQAALKNKDFYPDEQLYKSILQEVLPDRNLNIYWLYLLYLVDISLYYAEARAKAPDIGEDRVWEWYGKQIDYFLEGRYELAKNISYYTII